MPCRIISLRVWVLPDEIIKIEKKERVRSRTAIKRVLPGKNFKALSFRNTYREIYQTVLKIGLRYLASFRYLFQVKLFLFASFWGLFDLTTALIPMSF